MENHKQIQASAILMTDNYDIFKYSKHNRDIKEKTVKKIMDSIKRIDMSPENPIKVNENYEIIDGQHRLEAWKRLGLPVYYMKSKIKKSEMDIAIIAVNANQSPWALDSYINFWAKKGNKVYQEILECNKKFKLPFHISALLVTNELRISPSDMKDGTLKKGKISYMEYVNCLNDFHDIFKYAKTTFFIRAFMWMYKSGMYNHKKHFEKFVVNRYRLKRCADREQYLQMFEEILNWHSRDKITLKIEKGNHSKSKNADVKAYAEH